MFVTTGLPARGEAMAQRIRKARPGTWHHVYTCMAKPLAMHDQNQHPVEVRRAPLGAGRDRAHQPRGPAWCGRGG